VLYSRVLSHPADALSLAAALEGEPEAFLLWDGTGRTSSFLGCGATEVVEGLVPVASEAFDSSQYAFAPRWVGVLPYEAMRHLEKPGAVLRPDPREAPQVERPRWWRFEAVCWVPSRGPARVIGESSRAVQELSDKLGRARPTSSVRLRLAEDPEPAQRHVERIRAALELIARGELYQVNLARRFELQSQGHPFSLLRSLGEKARFPFAAAMRLGALDLVSSSPELFLRVEPGGRLLTSPIKGTRPRGVEPERDRELSASLEASEKERAELTMVLDVERNDLGRIARAGSVRMIEPPHVTTHPTLHHRSATLEARLLHGTTLREVLEAMLPSGSVTGAPKRRAMEVIASLEPHRRGLYTGAFGAMGYDGGMTLAMAIRTLTSRGGVGHYFSGGGIVADSDPYAEVEETDWKALQLLA